MDPSFTFPMSDRDDDDSFIVITRDTVSSIRSSKGSTPNSNENVSPVAVNVQDKARKPLEELSANKPGARGRAGYRFLNRERKRAREVSCLAEQRLNLDAIEDLFIYEKKNVKCCQNFCCGQLMGASQRGTISLNLTTETAVKKKFFHAVRATRDEIHKNGQTHNKRNLLSRLKLGFTEGMIKPNFAKDYYFPGARSESRQEYWWRTEEGACVQVSSVAQRDKIAGSF